MGPLHPQSSPPTVHSPKLSPGALDFKCWPNLPPRAPHHLTFTLPCPQYVPSIQKQAPPSPYAFTETELWQFGFQILAQPLSPRAARSRTPTTSKQLYSTSCRSHSSKNEPPPLCIHRNRALVARFPLALFFLRVFFGGFFFFFVLYILFIVELADNYGYLLHDFISIIVYVYCVFLQPECGQCIT